MTSITEIIDNLKLAVSHERVFGQPVQHGNMTLTPASNVTGGAGGGVDRRSGDYAEDADGSGGGFGVSARPAGVLILEADKVRWKPTVDLNRAILGGQAVAITWFVAKWLIERTKSKASVEVARATARSVRG